MILLKKLHKKAPPVMVRLFSIKPLVEMSIKTS